MKVLNLNSDLGESFGAWAMGSDDAMLETVNSANVACGFHAGDPLVMANTVASAKKNGVSIGAHPSFPDLQGFGRRRMDIPAVELEAMLVYQIGALDAFAKTQGVRVTHVKPHGALNNIACVDRKVADAVVRAVRALDDSLVLLAPAASVLIQAGCEAGLPVVEEIFADRAYMDDGQLVPRSQPGAMIHGAQESLQHVLRIIEAGALISINGKKIHCSPQSVCVHGDGADAVASAKAIREGLLEAGYQLVTIPQLLGGKV